MAGEPPRGERKTPHQGGVKEDSKRRRFMEINTTHSWKSEKKNSEPGLALLEEDTEEMG